MCILAHNEQKNIAETIKTIICNNRELDFDVIVYANGCTDDTVYIVKKLCLEYRNLYLRIIRKASKTHAWNLAFHENNFPYIIFSDGDVKPEPDSVLKLYEYLKHNFDASLVCSQFWPCKKNLSFEQKIIGFLQIPLFQDFLTGCFYGVNREKLKGHFKKKSINKIPTGVIGEDYFLKLVVPDDEFFVITKKCYFTPPKFIDYMKYLARIRWQDEQLNYYYKNLFEDITITKEKILPRLKMKLNKTNFDSRFFIGCTSAFFRYIFLILFNTKINYYHNRIGPVKKNNNLILSTYTRSKSTK